MVLSERLFLKVVFKLSQLHLRGQEQGQCNSGAGKHRRGQTVTLSALWAKQYAAASQVADTLGKPGPEVETGHGLGFINQHSQHHGNEG